MQAAALGTIFGWAFFSFWSAIPAGLALNVSPVLVALTVTLSYGCGVAMVTLAGVPVRERIQKRIVKNNTSVSEDNRMPNRMALLVQRAWGRFGVVGLSLLAPMTVGAQVGAVIGLSLGAQPLRLIIAMTLGAGLWSVALTLAVATGIMVIAQ